MQRLGAFGLVAFAFLVAASPAGAQVTVTSIETVGPRLLAAHNAERVRLGLKPLVWSAQLSEHAKKWAQTLAVSDMFEHAPVGADGGEGENLWTGTRGDYTPEEMVASWLGESQLFKRGKFPDVSQNGRWEDVGHYTQIVWTDTREVGCAIASNPRGDYLVCRYFPAGNIKGKPVYDYKATARIAVAAPVTPPAESEIEISAEDAPAKAAPAAVVPTVPPKPVAVSPSKPTKPVSKKRRRGG